MSISYLVNPDLTTRTIDLDLDHVAQFLGGADSDRASVAFQGDGISFAALYSAKAKLEGAEPNPVASLARNQAATGDSEFFTDPTRAICGPVLFVGAEGDDISESSIAEVNNGIRAVRNYREDQPDEYVLWRGAVLNLGRRLAAESDFNRF